MVDYDRCGPVRVEVNHEPEVTGSRPVTTIRKRASPTPTAPAQAWVALAALALDSGAPDHSCSGHDCSDYSDNSGGKTAKFITRTLECNFISLIVNVLIDVKCLKGC